MIIRKLARAQSLYKLKKYDHALSILENDLLGSSWDGQVYSLIHSCYLEKSMFSEAKTAIEFAISNNPENIDFKASLAFLHIKNQEFREAVVILKNNLVEEPVNSYSKFLLAQAYANMGNNSQALTIIGQLLNSDPEQSNYKCILAIIYINTGKLNSAKRLIQEIRENDPENKHVLEIQMDYQKVAGDSASVIAAAYDALAQNPENDSVQKTLRAFTRKILPKETSKEYGTLAIVLFIVLFLYILFFL